MPVLIDVEAVPEDILNDCLCDMHKAIAEHGTSREESIWAPHENPFLTAHVEAVTRLLQGIAEKIQDAIATALLGRPIGELAKAETPDSDPWLRWDQAEFDRVRAYLEGRDPSTYTLDDWLMLSEFIVQRYCGPGVIKSAAEYLTVRAALLGKIQASAVNLAARPKQFEELVDLLPTDFAKVPARVLTPVERATLRISRERAGESIALAMDSAKARMKSVICEHVQAQVLGQREGNAAHLKTRLFDNFGTLNRDFRRIAVTEAGECCNQAYVATNVGRKVRRTEAYKGACPFCQSINGKVFDVVAASALDKNGQTQVWEGKNNVGRSAAPRKRVPGGLIERGPEEMWWPAAGVQHPHCRGSWTAVVTKPPAVSDDFQAWMEAKLKKAIPNYKGASE